MPVNKALFLPQYEKKTWDEANYAISYLLKKREPSTEGLRQHAHHLSVLFNRLFPLLDRLCRLTCRFCPDPCCLAATIWFDLKDMVMLHLLNRDIPFAQPLSRQEDHCRYLGIRGCTLPRHDRPFICTLYLCPPQMRILRKEPDDLKLFSDTISSIKEKRNDLEHEFIRITSGRA